MSGNNLATRRETRTYSANTHNDPRRVNGRMVDVNRLAGRTKLVLRQGFAVGHELATYLKKGWSQIIPSAYRLYRGLSGRRKTPFCRDYP